MRPDHPAFLVDRSLGRFIVPERVIEVGYECITLAEFYGDEQLAQDAADVAWLDASAPDRLVILTRDGNLYTNPHELHSVRSGQHRIFWLGPKKGPGVAWADRFEKHHSAIARYAMQPGPYVVKVQDHGLERAWP